MTMVIETALVRAIAPPCLAEAIIGDLHERGSSLAQTYGDARALAICRTDMLRSLPSLAAYSALRVFIDNWCFAFVTAAVICALCVASIPFWDHLGMGGGVYHLVRLAIIGLILGSIRRASALSCLFLLVLIGISDRAMDAHNTSFSVLQDGITMAAMLIALPSVKALLRLYSARR